MERLDKFISNATTLSRKDARGAIKIGKVEVDGVVVKDFSKKVDTENSNIMLNGQAVKFNKTVYYMLNKPKGLLSASSDSKRKTVVDLIYEKYGRKDVFPVGRLDKDTTGLLIITNDGDFAHNVISPSKHIPKEYYVELDGEVTESVVAAFKNGVVLADGTKCLSAVLNICADNKRAANVVIEEGKYHQIKRMFGTQNLGVVELKRVRIGNIKLDVNLAQGDSRPLTEQELQFVIKI